MRSLFPRFSQGAAALLFLSSAAASADDCVPKFVPEAEFGQRELVVRTNCPGLTATEDHDCVFSDGGVEYGVSEGLLIHKEAIDGTYNGPLPFGLKWGEDLQAVRRKVEAITGGALSFAVEETREGVTFSTQGYCLLTLRGAEYALVLDFGRDAALSRVEGRILYP